MKHHKASQGSAQRLPTALSHTAALTGDW
jgi:hypothetical protein